MSLLQNTLNDLRERHLWPLALILAVALVAVPVLLSSSPSSSSTLPNASPVAAAPANPATALPAVSVSEEPAQSRLKARRRDPFAQQKLPHPKSISSLSPATPSPGSAGAGTPSSSGSTGSPSGSGAGGASQSGGNGSSGGTGSGSAPTPTPTPTPIVLRKPAKPAPTGLKDTQSYAVSFVITRPDGGLDTIDPLERLSVLPSRQMPLMVELGVLKGGHRVLFLVQPGAVLSGPGRCTPGPLDCEILSLAPDQVETLGMSSSAGTTNIAEFAIASISAANHKSVAAADRARRQASALGRELLGYSDSTALSLFQYKPSLGAVVDLRNLTVGGK